MSSINEVFKSDNKLISNGVYSVKNKQWIKEPVQADIPEVDEEAINEQVGEWTSKYNEVVESRNIDEIDQFIEDVYNLRKEAMAKGEEYNESNLVFKELRNAGYLDNLKELKAEIKSEQLSLESLQEDTVKIKDHKWVNKGNEGTHGEFKTKKAADAQRKAMFANGYKEELTEAVSPVEQVVKDSIYTLYSKGCKDITVADVAEDIAYNYEGYEDWQAEIELPIETEKYKDILATVATYFNEYYDEYFKENLKEDICTVCGGEGEIDDEICPECGGVGETGPQADEYNNCLEERLFDKEIHDYKGAIWKAIRPFTSAQPIIHGNGIVEFNLVKENEVDKVMYALRRLDFIKNVTKAAGKFDFSRPTFTGNQARYWSIHCQIIENEDI